eukprot:Sspe_Gene.90838::Locus_62321_Transcript_3_3_Confidence_0.600_Length_1563::g.90838::m.90838
MPGSERSVGSSSRRTPKSVLNDSDRMESESAWLSCSTTCSVASVPTPTLNLGGPSSGTARTTETMRLRKGCLALLAFVAAFESLFASIASLPFFHGTRCQTPHACSAQVLRCVACILLAIWCGILATRWCTSSKLRSCATYLWAPICAIAAVRLLAESVQLMSSWSLPLLPKLSSAYCKLRAVVTPSGSLSAQCEWQASMSVLRMKEIACIISTFCLFAVLARVASGVVSKEGIRGWQFVTRLLLFVAMTNAVFESFILSVYTFTGQMGTTTSTAPIEGWKLLLAATGALLEVLACRSLIMRGKGVHHASLGVGIVGAFLRFAGEAAQFFPFTAWVGRNPGQFAVHPLIVIEMVTHSFFLFAFVVSAFCFRHVVLREVEQRHYDEKDRNVMKDLFPSTPAGRFMRRDDDHPSKDGLCSRRSSVCDDDIEQGNQCTR